MGLYTPADFQAAIKLLGLEPAPYPGEEVVRIELFDSGWVVWYESAAKGPLGQPMTRREKRGYVT